MKTYSVSDFVDGQTYPSITRFASILPLGVGRVLFVIDIHVSGSKPISLNAYKAIHKNGKWAFVGNIYGKVVEIDDSKSKYVRFKLEDGEEMSIPSSGWISVE